MYLTHLSLIVWTQAARAGEEVVIVETDIESAQKVLATRFGLLVSWEGQSVYETCRGGEARGRC
jgi:hypothetical protein